MFTVCEFPETRRKLTNYPDGGMEGGYQLPDSGPPRQRDWFSRRKYGGRKRANQRQMKRCTLEQAGGVVEQRLS